MMTPGENLLSLYKRNGYDYAPVFLDLCPSKEKEFKKSHNGADYRKFFDFPEVFISDLGLKHLPDEVYLEYFDSPSGNLRIDKWGVGYEPGSEACAHMEHFVHPMKNFSTLSDFESYPYPAYLKAGTDHIRREVEEIHKNGYLAKADMADTVWEVSWYMRSMEQLMTDMILNRDLAEYHLDRVTEISCHRAGTFALSGVDVIITGDDVGMQNSLMMSEDMYIEWIKPRFEKIVRAAKEAKPDIIIEYHSCGYVEPLIPHFIECGIDILNPIQPECMDFEEIYTEYSDRISFRGTIGTQTTMPFGSPGEVMAAVERNLDIAGMKGGLYCCPTHMIEPDVPWDNINAYIEACHNYRP